MIIYFAGDGRGDSSVSARDYIYVLFKNINKVLSYHNEKEWMELYFAGGENKSWLNAIEEAGGEKSLYSYFYLSEGNIEFLEQASQTQSRIFIDSGGYSAFSRDAKIDIDGYIEWIQKHEDEIDVYAVLDKIGDPKGTLKNQRYMESKGLSPLPAFHYGSDLAMLKDLVAEYDYLALGGLVPFARQKEKLKRWLDKCFNVIRSDAKVHGFGVTGVEILKRYPFYSVDSTSWLGGSIRSEVYTFHEGAMKVGSG